jgi:hypothetical protein
LPIGSVSLPGRGKKTLPPIRVFGTVAASFTLIQCVHFIDPKYFAASCISSSVMSCAPSIICCVFILRGSALVRRPFLKSFSCWTK